MAEDPPQKSENPVSVGHTIDPAKEHHENIYSILTNQDEITWKSLIIELIKSEKMDPWDINVSELSRMYIKTLKKLKEMNLTLSGKVLLAAALLLRIKCSRLIGDDMMEFDRLLASGENGDDLYSDENFVEGELGSLGMKLAPGQLKLTPKTPQPRKRKVSVYDLIDALAIALNVRRRRILNQIQTKTMSGPEKKTDISELMNCLYEDVLGYLTKDNADKMAFSELVPGDSKQDKVYTFLPLLYLTNARKVDLEQKRHFDEIWISLAKKETKKDTQKKSKQKEESEAPEQESDVQEESEVQEPEQEDTVQEESKEPVQETKPAA